MSYEYKRALDPEANLNTAPTVAPVEQGLNRLFAILEEAGKGTAKLEERLSYVLSPMSPQKEAVDPPRASSSPLGAALQELEFKALMINARINQIKSRLEI